MDFANLQAFIAVAEAASFSGAAERLHLTQPAVSKRVAALEEELGSPLFDRIGRHIDLTEAGRALLPRAHAILDAVEDSRRAVSNLAGRVEGPLVFATSHHIGLHRLPPILRAYSSRYPRVELDLRFMDSETACEAALHGEVELGIVTLPLAPPAHLRVQPVWDDPLRITVAPDHPLAGRGEVPASALAAETAVLPGPDTYTRQVIEAALGRLGVAPQVRLSTNYLETLKMLAAVGLGWTVLPKGMLDAEVVALQVPGFQAQRRLGVVRHTGRTLSNAGRALIGLLTGRADGAAILD